MKDNIVDPLAEGVRDYIEVLEGKKPAAQAQIGGEQEFTNEQRRILPYVVALYRQPCSLCGAEPPCFQFLPFKSNNPISPWVIAGVCKVCAQQDKVAERILVALQESAE